MRAALYGRVSTQDQAREEKVSLETQTSDIEKYCRDKGYELVEPHYIDIQSGQDTMKDRPEFERMLSDSLQGRFDVVVAWQPDRLFRSMWPAARLKRTIDEAGIDIETVKQSVDKKMLGLWAWLAEMEIENFKERSCMGKQGVALKGKVVTRQVQYGYYVDSERYPHVNEEEAYIVCRIFREYLQGKPIPQIARGLDEDHVPTRNNAKYGWSTVYMHRMLKDKAYIGQGAYGKSRRIGGKDRRQPEEKHITIPFPPIIDEATFQLVQDRKANTRNRQTKHQSVFRLLRDLAYCQECGNKLLTRFNWTDKRRRKSGKIHIYQFKQPLSYYLCYGMFRYPQHFHCWEHSSINAYKLDELVWQKVVELIKNPGVIAEGIKSYKEQPQNVGLIEELEKAKRQVSELSWKRQKTINLHIDGIISQEDLNIQLKFIKPRKEFFEAEVDRLSKETEKVQQQEVNLASFEQMANQVRDRITNMPDDERLELVQLLVNKVWVNGAGHVTIEFGIPENILALCNDHVKAGYGK